MSDGKQESAEPNPNYEVGYRRPPAHRRYKKGVSGNPKGRPKGARNITTDLREELAERVTVREGEKRVRCSKQRVIIKRLTNDAAQGETRAIGQIVALLGRSQEEGDAQATVPDVSPEDMDMLRDLNERINAKPNGASQS